MNLSINKIVYNVLEEYPDSEEISVTITAKFGVANEDHYTRAFFLELNINGEEENGNDTRNLTIVARFNYQLDKVSLSNIDEKEIEEDREYFLKFLNRINNVIIDVTSQDDIGRPPLNINKAIENFNK
ncbi:hypothetical protein AAF454_13720 [Kurthia gibsonii]|uniref:Uncharacterized protein n=1 Tax=Kurthia gibsonii TaxID=33946 RepID=A0ABU9LQX6_9BACL|nr:hypothetical protein [Kurthia sp. 11kri321]AMA62062.1 hypothetical protein ASO14_370 [Kurthia sp. 11kri321]